MQNHFFKSVGAMTVAYMKRTFRDPVALFFTFLFPLMFLLVFGSLNRNDGGINFDVAVFNQSQTEFAANFVEQLRDSDSITVKDGVADMTDARERMGRGELDSILEIPDTFGQPNTRGIPTGTMAVYYEEASPQSGQTVAAVMQSIFERMNQELTQTVPPLTVEQRSTATTSLSSFDYIFAGLIAFSILSLGIFGMANGFPAEKKTGSFRRLRVAPIRPVHLIFANALNYLIIGLLSVAVLVVAGIFIFDFQMQGNYLVFAVFTVISIIMMFGFGLAIAGWAKNEMQAAPLSNLVAFPMMFLSGVFFPRFLMPEWLQSITGYLPLSPIVDGLRGITAEGKALLDLGPEMLIIGIWTVVIYLIAIKVFRWE